MQPPEPLTVYRFWVYDLQEGTKSFSSFSATREAIRTFYKSEPIEMTAIKVAAEDIDHTGTYRRRPTGWGLTGPDVRATPGGAAATRAG